MTFYFSASLIPLLIGVIIPGWLAIYVSRNRKSKGARFLSIFMMLLFFWGAAYILELASATLETKIFWNNISFIFIAFTPLSLLLFSIEYTERGHWLTPFRLGAALLFPISTVIVIFTPALRPWFWVSQSLVQQGDLLLINGVNGWWYWNVHAIYSYLGLLSGVTLLVLTLLKWPRQYRWQMIWTLIAISVPWVANAITIFKILPIYIDLTPFAFSITGVGLTFAVVRHRMLDLAPIARAVVVEGLQDGVLILDATNRAVDANIAVSRLLSLQTEVVGQSISQIFAKWPEIAKTDMIAAKGRNEIELIDENGARQYLEISHSPLYDRFQIVIGSVLSIRDITQTKETERLLLEARNKAVEANQLKSRFLAKVSHEFRTPLGGIIGYGELLEHESFGPLNEQQKKAVTSVISSAQHLNEMVSELLDQAQIESGTLVLQNGPFTLTALMESSLTGFAFAAEEKSLTLNQFIDPALPTRVIGDARRLRQIIINLVANAIKFTPEGNVDISFLQEGAAHWSIVVSDSGIGIPEDALADIFNPFKQVSSEISHKNRGIGLGLSITRDLVALMNGSIHVKSEPDQGTEFRVRLPLEPVA
jgi:PAS domain S-box-containing protein